MKWNPITIIHDSFEIGILIKGIDAVLEIIGSALVLLIRPKTINHWIYALTTHELSTDPKDWVANHLVQFAQGYSTHSQWFAAIYLASHGIIKIFLVVSLWQKRLWAYPTAIVVFSLFGFYQIYLYTITQGFSLILLTVLDVIVIGLTYLEYERLKGNLHS